MVTSAVGDPPRESSRGTPASRPQIVSQISPRGGGQRRVVNQGNLVDRSPRLIVRALPKLAITLQWKYRTEVAIQWTRFS